MVYAEKNYNAVREHLLKTRPELAGSMLPWIALDEEVKNAWKAGADEVIDEYRADNDDSHCRE